MRLRRPLVDGHAKQSDPSRAVVVSEVNLTKPREAKVIGEVKIDVIVERNSGAVVPLGVPTVDEEM